MGGWKDGANCAVAVSFDVDAETLWFDDDRSAEAGPGALSQGTYGPQVGLPLILDLLERQSLPATFFVPGWVAHMHREAIAAIHDAGHEIAHHGWLHESPAGLPREQQEEVLRKGIEALRSITGRDPVGYRSPAWEFSGETLRLLTQYGFRYSSNMMDRFFPYVHTGADIVELPVQWILDDAPFFLFRFGRFIATAEHVYQVWSEEFRGIYRWGGLFTLTMHPQLIGRPGRLLMLERLIGFIKGFDGVWFATGAEVSRHCLEHGCPEAPFGFKR